MFSSTDRLQFSRTLSAQPSSWPAPHVSLDGGRPGGCRTQKTQCVDKGKVGSSSFSVFLSDTLTDGYDMAESCLL